LLLLAVVGAFAHPHVFVDAKVQVLFNEKGLSGVKNHWVYDEIYSTAMVSSVDSDGDGKLSSQEGEILKSSILGEISRSNYFNYIQFGADFLKAGDIKNFRASVANRRLVLDFVIEFAAPVVADYSMLVIVVADPTNYVQVTTDMENADVAAPGSIDVEYFSDSLEGLSLFRAFLSDVQGLYLRFKRK
jgi:ABC-type uncharacterized transport system substrate-binding protein